MINFNKNRLINITLDKYYDTFSHTLDTADYVPDKYNKKIIKYIYKNMKKSFKKIDKEDNKYQRELKKKYKLKQKQLRQPSEDNKSSRLLLFLKSLFNRKTDIADITTRDD